MSKKQHTVKSVLKAPVYNKKTVYNGRRSFLPRKQFAILANCIQRAPDYNRHIFLLPWLPCIYSFDCMRYNAIYRPLAMIYVLYL